MNVKEAGHVGPACVWPRRSGRRWCVVQTEYRQEALAEREVAAAGYMVYLPRYKTRIREPRNHRKWIDAARPLFPGYLLAYVGDRPASLWRLGKVRGVRGVPVAAGVPLLVPDALVAALRAEEGINFRQPYQPKGPAVPFKPGEPVRVGDGSFSGVIGRIEAVDGPDRITVLIDFLGRLSPVGPFTVDQLERA